MPNNQRTAPKIKHFAVVLRHESTPEERKLWSRLRNDQLGVSFRRQHAIGPYIADFCAIQANLIVELDGGGHTEQVEYDAVRTAYLEERGYRVIRFWNHEVNRDIESVVRAIYEALDPGPP